VIDIIIVDHEPEDRARMDPEGWANIISASTDDIRSVIVINANTGLSLTYRDDDQGK
jgi:hypothetical protein